MKLTNKRTEVITATVKLVHRNWWSCYRGFYWWGREVSTAGNVQVTGGTGPNGIECCSEANDTERKD
jgi:hypothetical protein